MELGCRVRTAERIDERKYKRRHALSVRSGMVAGKDGQKSGFARPWIKNHDKIIVGLSGQRTVCALEVPTISFTDGPVDIF